MYDFVFHDTEIYRLMLIMTVIVRTCPAKIYDQECGNIIPASSITCGVPLEKYKTPGV
jgi:hypothetical protein